MPLPIDDLLPELRSALEDHTRLVLHAPPGTGKTTGVPPALLDAPWLDGTRIVMLEPRRLAARAAAAFMARGFGEPVGKTVGYRVRMDTKVSAETRIEVVTEGVLTRMLQSDPGLEGVGLVIFDEFHERSLQADLGLALCLETQAVLRPDLRLLVMSATLEGSRVAALLENAPVLSGGGRSFPVETRHLQQEPDERIEVVVSRAAQKALAEVEGDVLVFLPGQAEIHRTADRLREMGLGDHVDVVPLHGSLPLTEQDRAIEPAPEGRRKVVLSTDIAETSLTIEGIRAVVDGGWRRAPRFDPGSGMTRLVTLRVSKASADQRRGRAGRLGPGVCYRLWTRHTHQHLAAFGAPEILEADLAPLALDLARWGVSNPLTLRWLDPPPDASFGQARELLQRLGALDASGRVTEHGRLMAELPIHPRLAHMVLRARALDLGGTACDLAALLSERDFVRSQRGRPASDARLRLEVMRRLRERHRDGSGALRDASVDSRAAERVLKVADHWRKTIHIPRKETTEVEAAGLLFAFAYPDRIGRWREGQPGRYLLSNGRAARFEGDDSLAEAPFVVAAHVDGKKAESLIYLAAPVSRDDLERHFAQNIASEEEVLWDFSARRVVSRRVDRLGALMLREAPLSNPDPEAVMRALLEGIRLEGLGALPWTKESNRLRERMAFLHHLDPAYPDVSNEALLADLESWLGPHIHRKSRLPDLQSLNLIQLLLDRLSWDQRVALDRLAPSHVTVPSGSNIPVDYSDPDKPVLAVRLQEVFGLTETPRVGGGKVPLTMHLLSPAHRPVQVTQDLAGFWRTSYFEVRKEMRGRYPKHVWPEDPLLEPPTRRVKPRNP